MVSMPLDRLLAAISSLEPASSPTLPASDALVGGIAYDTRRLVPGDLFVCLRGQLRDSHDLAPQAWRAGALAVVGERPELASQGPYIQVRDSRRALALLAARLYDDVSRRLEVVPITGTNGKTSTTWMLSSIWAEAGISAAVIGTLGSGTPPDLQPSVHTTPEAPDLQAQLSRLRHSGTRAVGLEVSSHGLALERTYGMRFRVGVFTNLTTDHLDFHGSMEEYAAAKNRLFRAEMRGPEERPMIAVVNGDDPWLPRILEGTRDEVWRFGRSAGFEIWAERCELSPGGIGLTIGHPRGRSIVASPLLGEFQVDNLLAAFGATLALGIDPETAARGLGRMRAIPGRMERLETGQPFNIVVDYAHTPAALSRALRSLRPFTPGRLVVVFGCGGDRDRTKRPEMGLLAGRLADAVVLTDDNPRGEDPAAIRAAVRTGLEATSVEFVEIGDRAEAIAAALAEARPGDTILIAGKGAETTQTIGDAVHPFDDRKAAAAALLQPSWTLGQIAIETGGTLSDPARAEQTVRASDLCSDTRALSRGAFFVALRGEQFDGHAFLDDAASRAAAGALVERGARSDSASESLARVEVDDTLAALQRWAGAHRSQWGARPLVAITGSSGKTTTKDLLAHLLQGAGPTLATERNLNNHVGVPWTLLRLAPAHEAAVVELGMNHAGEISLLSRLARPSVAVLTDVGTAHVGHLGSREAVLAAKLEILEGLAEDAPFVVVHDPWVLARLPRRAGRTVTFGFSPEATWHPIPGSVEMTLTGTRFQTTHGGSIALSLLGPGALLSALAALASLDALGLDAAALAPRLASAPRRPLRMEPRLAGGVTWLLDCYNASPESTRLALDFARTVPHPSRRVLVLGELGELGAHANEIHRELGERAAGRGGPTVPDGDAFGLAYFIGEGARPAEQAFHAARSATAATAATAGTAATAATTATTATREARWFASTVDAIAPLGSELAPSDLVLLKGSRRTALERIFTALAASPSHGQEEN